MAGKKIDIQGENGQQYSIIVAKNQKVIKIHRIQKSINFEANKKAMEDLSDSAYKMYMYLLLHEQNRVWALSRTDACNRTKQKERTYLNSIKELISKKYLTKGTIDLGYGDKKYKENAYHLWETPSLIKEENPIGDEVFEE